MSTGNRRSGHPVLLNDGKGPSRLKRIDFGTGTFDEAWLQEQIRVSPELLPVTEIEPAFAPLATIGCEVSTAADPYRDAHEYRISAGMCRRVEGRLSSKQGNVSPIRTQNG